ncbi:MAG: tetratricopeptide repeat protein [Chitinophagales bacterium]
MKTLFFSFVVIFIALHPVYLQAQNDDAQSFYEKGVDAYEQGLYEEALEHFINAIESSDESNEKNYTYIGKSYYALQKSPLDSEDEDIMGEDTGEVEETKAESDEVDEQESKVEDEVNTANEEEIVQEDDLENEEKITLVPDLNEQQLSNKDIGAAVSAFQGGVAAYKQSDFVSAIQYFTIIIEADEGNAEKAFNYRGMCYHALGDYAAAIADYDHTIELEEDSYIAHHNRGISKQNSKLYNEALIDFNKAIRLNPSYARAYESRAVLYYRMRDLEKAMKDCDKILQLDANNENAKRLKAKLEQENK